MLFKQRYKKFSKHFYPLSCIPKKKILKFHRPKWKKIQKLILNDTFKEKTSNQKFKINLKLKHFGNLFCYGKRWEKASQIFQNQLNFKSTIQTLFLNSVSNRVLKQIFLQKKLKYAFVSYFLYKLEYRLDILLSRLQIFNNSFTVKKNLEQNLILINHKKIKSLGSLVKGDILTVNNLQKILFRQRLKESFFFHTFIEIDYYTNELVVIKNLSELTEKDFFLLTRDIYNFLDLKEYFNR